MLGHVSLSTLSIYFQSSHWVKKETSRTKQIELIQQSYLTFETENFSCPVSCLT